MPELLTTKQIAKLRSLGQTLEASHKVGKAGVTPAFIQDLKEALSSKELVKVKFVEHKDQKKELAEQMVTETGAVLAQRLGHTILLYVQQPDPAKRKIRLG